MAYRNEMRMLYPPQHSRVCAELFTEDSFERNCTVRSFLGLSFKPRRLTLKKDAVPTICNFTVARCKPAIGQTNNETQANNALRTTGEFLGHFPSKIKFGLRSKTFPMNDSLTPKRSNVQDSNNVTKQTFSSIPSIKLRGHFGNVFLKPSAVFALLTFLLLFTDQKKKSAQFSF